MIFYDPLMIDNDANICNNFLTIPVHVMCSGSKYKDSSVLPPPLPRGMVCGKNCSGFRKGGLGSLNCIN